ncbi:hypothetical protein BVRB_031400, partial [Beta vulgaris subsp. vulgaris]
GLLVATVMFDWELKKDEVKQGESQALLMELLEVRTRLALDDSVTSRAQKTELRKKLLSAIEEHKMGPFLRHVTSHDSKFQTAPGLQEKLDVINAQELAEIEAKIKDAVDSLGESEV